MIVTCELLQFFTSVPILNFLYFFVVPLEMPIVAREHFNRWYSLKCYYLAVTLADIPIQVRPERKFNLLLIFINFLFQAACSLGYTILVYFLSAQPFEANRFLMFAGMGLLVSFVAQSVGQMVGAGLSVEVNLIFSIKKMP